MRDVRGPRSAASARSPSRRPDPAMAAHPLPRISCAATPDGSWVAEDEQGLAGCALALRREDVWGLSLLVVRPDLQSSGVGSARCCGARTSTRTDARGRIILSSPDPRAMRAYFRLGLDLHPARARPRASRATCTRRTGCARATRDDLPFTGRGRPPRPRRRARRRHRHAARDGPDAADRARARLRGRRRRRAAAAGARSMTKRRRTSCARRSPGPTGTVRIEATDRQQQWAIAVCMEAGLDLRLDAGAVFPGGDVGRSRPTCLSGAFL